MADQNLSQRLPAAAPAPTKAAEPHPPDHLSEEAQLRWRAMVEEYELDDAGALLILTSAFEHWDRKEMARRQIAKDGLVFRDRWGKPRTHPMVSVELKAQAAFLAALKQLNLDLEPLRDAPGRPPGSPMDPSGRQFGGLFRPPED